MLQTESLTEPTPRLSDTHRFPALRSLNKFQESTLIPSTLNKPMLKVSPRISPRAIINPPVSLRSLMVGAQLSHYNYLASSFRSPHKSDHFHTKTFITSFIPSFRATRFAHAVYEVNRPEETFILESLPSHIPKKPRRLPILNPSQSSPVSDYPLMSPIAPTLTQHPAKPRKAKKPRTILCLEDGESLSNPSLRTHVLDFEDFVRRYVAFDRHGYYLPSRNKAVSLETQAMSEILEKVTMALEPEKPFVAMFLVDGKRIAELVQVPKDCGVLLFSSSGKFKGVQE